MTATKWSLRQRTSDIDREDHRGGDQEGWGHQGDKDDQELAITFAASPVTKEDESVTFAAAPVAEEDDSVTFPVSPVAKEEAVEQPKPSENDGLRKRGRAAGA